MGISFYTFQTLSYTIDVYRGELAPVRSFWQFILFISFFPQLVAGPIVRASEFLPQMARPRRLRLRVFYEGVWLVIGGLFLKMVCADNLAAYVDEHWHRGSAAGGDATMSLWLGVMFSGQIFADFCGYSTIARGLGYLLGYRFPLNFDAPYIAATFKNFWERWHITLSRWLRDYLYVPLGGNRGSRARTYVNLLTVMLLGGLWHGAAYTYIVWGAIHGAVPGAGAGAATAPARRRLPGAVGRERHGPWPCRRPCWSRGSTSAATPWAAPRPSWPTWRSARGQCRPAGCSRRCCSCYRSWRCTSTPGWKSTSRWGRSALAPKGCWRPA